jgi:hypothetical protein
MAYGFPMDGSAIPHGSIKEILAHDEVDGVHLNLEPLPSGSEDYLSLLVDINKIKGNKLLSIAAYPPPTFLHPHPEVHWELGYYRQVCSLSDQVVPMMYDTAIGFRKVYTNLLRQWTVEIIAASGDKQVLFGIPAYEDADVGYHQPEVENVSGSLPGVVAGINDAQDPRNFGFSVYADWTLDDLKVDTISAFTE